MKTSWCCFFTSINYLIMLASAWVIFTWTFFLVTRYCSFAFVASLLRFGICCRLFVIFCCCVGLFRWCILLLALTRSLVLWFFRCSLLLGVIWRGIIYFFLQWHLCCFNQIALDVMCSCIRLVPVTSSSHWKPNKEFLFFIFVINYYSLLYNIGSYLLAYCCAFPNNSRPCISKPVVLLLLSFVKVDNGLLVYWVVV